MDKYMYSDYNYLNMNICFTVVFDSEALNIKNLKSTKYYTSHTWGPINTLKQRIDVIPVNSRVQKIIFLWNPFEFLFRLEITCRSTVS